MIPDASALIVAVPEAEPFVGDIRLEHDAVAALGVPAHVTVLYPFLPPERLSGDVLRVLADIVAALPAFRAEFAELRRFPGVLYLAPEPSALFRRLTEAVVSRFPETPPYGGQFADAVPHLTIGHAPEPTLLDDIEARFIQGAEGRLPIRTVVTHVTLIERADGRWRTRLLLPLSGPEALI